MDIQVQRWGDQMHRSPRMRSGLEIQFGSRLHIDGTRSDHLGGSGDREDIQGPYPGHGKQSEIMKMTKEKILGGRKCTKVTMPREERLF